VVESQAWLIGAVGLGLGLLFGFLLGRSRSRDAADRVRDLEDRIERATSDHERYRTQVSQHFVETSRRLHDLTVQYKSVYEHLADGARTLCPDAAVAIAPSLAEAALPETASTIESREIDDAQLDLELDPILDETTPPPPAERAS
jgi:hypothetical protein